MRAKAEDLLKLLESRNVIMFALLLHDILTPLTKASLTLQRTDASLYEVHSVITGTSVQVEKLKDLLVLLF